MEHVKHVSYFLRKMGLLTELYKDDQMDLVKKKPNKKVKPIKPYLECKDAECTPNE